jgi:hypothetical protein
MAEPSRSDPVEHLSNFVRTTPSFVRRREELSRLKNILQEMWSGTLRHPLQVGDDARYGEPIPLYLPFVQILPAVLDRSSLESERTLATNVQDRAEFQYESGLALRRDQDVSPCLTHYEEAVKVHRPVSNIRGLAKVLVETIETNLTLAAVRVGTLVDLQPLYFSDTAFSPVLPCAHS